MRSIPLPAVSQYAATLIVAALLMLLPTAVTAQSRAASTPFGQPMRGAVTMDDVMISVRTTLIALDQANKTGNYSVFRDIASTEFRKNSLENIAKLFEVQRKLKTDLSRAASIEPIMTIPAEILCPSKSTSISCTWKTKANGNCSASMLDPTTPNR